MDRGWTHEEVLKFHRQIDGLNWQFGGEKMRYNFLHRSEFLPHAVIPRAGDILPLANNPHEALRTFVVDSRYGRLALEDYVQAAPVNGIIILRRDRILFERYPRMRPSDKHLFMSVTKVFVSTVLAQFSARGLLDTSRPVQQTLPQTSESGWENVPVQDVLDMASGIHAPEEDEGFTNPSHPYYQYEASLGWLPSDDKTPDSTYEYVAGLRSHGPTGQQFEYTSVNTFLLGWLAETLTGLPLHEILAQEIWQKIGAEADALLAVSKTGAPAAHAGICATLRDLARFGLLFLPGAQEGIPPEHIVKIQTRGRPALFDRGPTGPSLLGKLHGEHPRHNIDQWDYVMDDGDFFKGGYGGQGLYISPARELVIAYFGTPFDETMQIHELEWITRQMVRSGLFD